MAREITVTIPISDEYIDDVLCSALEGGVSYWCDSVEATGWPTSTDEVFSSGVVTKGFGLIFHYEDNKSATLTIDNFLKGLEMFIKANKSGMSVGDILDAGNIDAMWSDAIVQYALFGEVIYG